MELNFASGIEDPTAFVLGRLSTPMLGQREIFEFVLSWRLFARTLVLVQTLTASFAEGLLLFNPFYLSTDSARLENTRFVHPD
jgi:hypothetical protein